MPKSWNRLSDEQRASKLEAEQLYAQHMYRKESGQQQYAERMDDMDKHLGREPGTLEKLFLSIFGL